jgi:hypothetical protein
MAPCSHVDASERAPKDNDGDHARRRPQPMYQQRVHEVRRRVAHPNLCIRGAGAEWDGGDRWHGQQDRLGCPAGRASKPNAALVNRSARTSRVNPSTAATKRPSVRSGPGSVGGRVCGDEPPLVGVLTLPMLSMTMHHLFAVLAGRRTINHSDPPEGVERVGRTLSGRPRGRRRAEWSSAR